MPRIKLTEDLVHEICQLMMDGYNNKQIASMCNLCSASVSAIRTRKKFTNISSKYNIPIVKLTDEVVHEICKLICDGYSNKYIASIFNINSSTVSNIRNAKSHKKICENYDLKRVAKIDELVNKACKMMEDGYRNIDICNHLNITKDMCNSIRNGKSYAYISINYNIPKIDKEYIDNRIIERVCKLLEAGYRNYEVAENCKVSCQVVSEIRCGKLHRDISKNYNIIRNTNQPRRVSDDDLHHVCQLLDKGYKISQIDKMSKLSLTTIQRIKYTDVYDDIACQYNFKKK